MIVSSSIAASSAFASVFASPTPMFSVIFSIRGTCMIELRPSSSWSCGRSSGVALLQARRVGRGRHQPVDFLAAAVALADADAHRLALDLLDLDPDPRRQVADRADEHHVRDVDRRGLLDPAARGHLRAAHAVGVAERARPRVPRHHVQVLDEDAAVARARLDDAALLAAVLAGQDLDEVALLDLHLGCHVSQSTSGARLTIFMKFFSRSSRATGPKMRVPRGLRAASMITAAFSSNAICVPSSRP